MGRRRLAVQASDLPVAEHMHGAIDWLLRARNPSGSGGISAAYDLLRDRWAPAYPETTGYTIPTLLACEEQLAEPRLREAAVSLADYLLTVRTPEGAVGHWQHQADRPLVFDTGQVIFGWLAAWQQTRDGKYRGAAEQAADWLASVQDGSGSWLRYQYRDTEKTIDTRVAWALLALDRALGTMRHEECARRNLDWALSQQQTNGWFRSAGFHPDEDPVTHTIGYTAEGLLESGLLLGEDRYLAAAEALALAMRQRQRPDGSLAATYDSDLNATSRSSCLTGNCQMALIWLRLYDLRQDELYFQAAGKAIAYVATTQDLWSTHPGVRGGIAGSHPIYGRYLRFKYPNWAAKFFVDALLAWEAAQTGVKRAPGRFPG